MGARQAASGDEHAWNMKATMANPDWFKDPVIVAKGLRNMVAQCVELHPSGRSLYTEVERKTMLAAAEHIERLIGRGAN